MAAKAEKVYDYQRSLSYAFWLLGRRAYTTAELREKLLGKQAEPEVVTRVIARLSELRYLDDKGYAESFVRSRQPRKGRMALRRELFRKGVSEQVVDEALGALELDTQVATAAALLEKHAWRFQKGDARKNYAKAYAFLARRGFTSDVVKAALERVQGSAGGEEPESYDA